MTRRKDPVTPDMRAAVLRRDDGCLAPRLGGSVHDCFGRNQVEHVKPELRMAVRAKSVPWFLVTLCDGHTEPGRKAGFQWNTNSENREKVRGYLAALYPDKWAKWLERRAA